MSNNTQNTDKTTGQIDQDQVIDYWRNQYEAIVAELDRLQCLTGLLAGQTQHSTAINLCELPCLIDPSIDRIRAINDEFGQLLYQPNNALAAVIVRPEQQA